MAVDYDLYLRCPLGLDATRQYFAERLGADTLYGLVARDGMTVDISETHLRTERTHQLFGFEPKIVATFRPDTVVEKETYFTNLRLMLEAASSFVVEHDATAVLLTLGETILMQRLEGVLELNSEYVEWVTLRVADRIPEPKLLRPLPSPLLAEG